VAGPAAVLAIAAIAMYGMLRHDAVGVDDSVMLLGNAVLAVALAACAAAVLAARKIGRMLNAGSADAVYRRRIESLIKDEEQLIEMVATGSPLAEVLDAVCAFVETQNPGVTAAVSLLDADGIHLHNAAAPHLPEAYSQAVDNLEIGPDVGSCGTAAYRKEAVIAEDIAQDERWRGYRDVSLRHGLRACWSTPILSARGDVLGTLSAYYHEPHAPESREDYVVQRAKHIAAVAIERQRSAQALRESEARYETIVQSEPECVKVIGPKCELLEMNRAGLEMLDADDIEQVRARGVLAFVEPEHHRRFIALHHRVLAGGTGIIQFDMISMKDRRRHMETHAAPLRDTSGRIYALLGITRDVTESKLAQERLTQLAQYDTLTGLPNRNLLRDRLTQAIARAKRDDSLIGLLVLDLDLFKEINDTLGHDAGDKVLCELGRRMRAALRDTDTLARLGGDEFVVIVESAHHLQQIEEVAHKVQSALLLPIVLEGRELFVTTSIGIAAYPSAAEDIESLLKNADIAMYRAKHAGRNAIVVYSHESHSKSGVRLTVESNLRRALERDEFTLHYQPQVDIATGRITGAEALIRWNNSELGNVPPLRFISIAEETGLIVPIGEWVLRTAATQASQWHASGLSAITVAVNLSPRQFRQANLASTVGRILRDCGLAAASFELEITEGAVMQNAAAAVGILHQLAEMGVQISIDDFGTGYSSLAYLQRFPVHKIKIDQSFVRTITNATAMHRSPRRSSPWREV
jgi:diguanylate cyclase (GGDEF)-like protein/PAS domain S-box-containing protein